jgi:hypothetical protein
MAAIRPHLL